MLLGAQVGEKMICKESAREYPREPESGKRNTTASKEALIVMLPCEASFQSCTRDDIIGYLETEEFFNRTR